MKIDKKKLKINSSEVPSDCKALIEKLKSCNPDKLFEELSKIKTWNYNKSELHHWIEVLNICDSILEISCRNMLKKTYQGENNSKVELGHEKDKRLLLCVLDFQSLLIENSFSQHIYNSMEHLTTLLSTGDADIFSKVLNLLWVLRVHRVTKNNSTIEEYSGNTNKSEYSDITPAMEAVIQNHLKNCPDDPNLAAIFTLRPKGWLNDEVINNYLTLIMERGKLQAFPTVCAYSTYFYPSLIARGITAVLRWTKKDAIFEKDLLFFPLNFKKHWALCVVDNRSRTIRYYDSSGKNHSNIMIIPIQHYLKEEIKIRNIIMDPDEYTLEVVKGLPKQDNSWDCGMFTLKYAEYISRDAAITFTQEKMPYFRRRMMFEIIKQHII